MRKRPARRTSVKDFLGNPLTEDHPVLHWSLQLMVVHRGMHRFVLDAPLMEHLGLDVQDELTLGDYEKGVIRKAFQARWTLVRNISVQDDALPAALLHNTASLGELLGASALEINLLRLAILMHTHPALHSAAHYVEDVTPTRFMHILSDLLDAPVADIAAALAEKTGVFIRAGLLIFDEESHGEELIDRLDLVSISFARNMLTMPKFNPAEIFKGVFQPCLPPSLLASHYSHMRHEFAIVRELVREAVATQRRGVNVLLYGEPGTGKTELSRLIVQLAGVPGFEVSYENELGKINDGLRRIRAWVVANTMMQNQAAILIFDEAEDAFEEAGVVLRSSTEDDRLGKGWMNRALENNATPTLWLTNNIAMMDAAYIRRFDLVMEIKQPTRAQRKKMAEDMVGHIASAATLERIAANAHLSPAIMQRVGQVVARLHTHPQRLKRNSAQEGEVLRPKDTEKTLTLLMDETLRAQGFNGLASGANDHARGIYDPAYTQADTDLNALAQQLGNHEASARICLYGPPGTGKTAYAQWLAEMADRPLLLKKASDLLDPYVGGTEQNMANAFREASDEGALLLIDEVDSFLQDRSKVRNGWEVSMVNEMLTQMERFEGVFIASTNLMAGLDPASLRRFDLKIRFGYLRPEQVGRLFKRWCKNFDLHTGVTKAIHSVSKLESVTPGDFAALARQHRFKPFPSAGAFAEALNKESALKAAGTGRRIGFL